MVSQGRWRRLVVRRVPPARRRRGGRQERVAPAAAAVVPAALPVQIVPSIRRRRRHPRRRCRRRPSSGCTRLRPPPQITCARRSQLWGVSDLLLARRKPTQRHAHGVSGNHASVRLSKAGLAAAAAAARRIQELRTHGFQAEAAPGLAGQGRPAPEDT